jgi:hypothetical protein
LRTFAAKAEGVAILGPKRYLIVFDDDKDWKTTFSDYETWQGLFETFNTED